MAGLTGNTKDTGNVNVRVDFVHGNFPMQPNDDRGGNSLDLTKGNHSVANVAWNGYPGEPAGVNVGVRGAAHRVVPTFVDQASKSAVIAAAKEVGFDEKDITWAVSDVGCLTKNYSTFKSVSPVATTQVTSPVGGITVTVYGSTMTCAVKTNAPTVKTVSLEPDVSCAAGNNDTTIAYYDWEVIDLSGKVTKYRKTTAAAFNHVFTTVGVQSVYLTITNTGGRSLKSAVKNFTTT